MSMGSESGGGLQPAFEEHPGFTNTGDPGRKQLQVSSFSNN